MMKLYMVSLGCAKNQVDSEMILGVLKNKFELVKIPEESDLIIINTCAFIESARKEAIDTILELSDYGKRLVVCGCLSQRYKDEIKNLLPEVNRFVSIDEYANLLSAYYETSCYGVRDNDMFGRISGVIEGSFTQTYSYSRSQNFIIPTAIQF